jgi:hypothetical protein
MIITILSEPRSGSSNLLFWFNQSKDFTILLEPSTEDDYKRFSSPPYTTLNKDVIIHNINNISTWEYSTQHLVIKEICYPNKNYENFFKSSNKVIILYRENYEEQKESWLMSVNTKKWGGEYFFDESLLLDKTDNHLIEIKEEIQKYKVKDNFIISYEELYFRGGINKLIDYIGIEELKTNQFPYGKKFRKNRELI